jgi:hypothetical protein
MRSPMVKAGLLFGFGILAYVALATLWPSRARAVTGTGQGPAFESIGPLAFGADGTLFAADNRAATIFALSLGQFASSATPGVGAVEAIDEKLAAIMGTSADQITITDLVVHPQSRNGFISVARGGLSGASPALFRVDGDGRIELAPLDTLRFSNVNLPNPPRSLMGRGPRADTVTDMAFIGNQLWVAGLSNEEFSSKLRSIPYPFATVDNGTSVEIFHGNHGAFETRSPVYTFLPYAIAGELHLIAGYLCTPLVKFPLSALKPGEKVRGTTIAELGNMNRPLDMIAYQKDGRDFLLVSNNSRGVMKIATDRFASASPITTRVSGEKGGIGYETMSAMRGVEQLDLLDQERVVTIARGGAGTLDLRAAPLP